MMRTIPSLVVTFALAASAGGQTNATTPTVYELVQGSTYQTGCFPPCACPVMSETPVEGMFRLAFTGADPLFSHYAITEVKWLVRIGEQEILITGAGTYKTGGEFALTHQLELDLAVGGNAPQHFDSGTVPGGGSFPKIDIVISIHGMQCFDTVIHVIAAPLGEVTPKLPRHANFVLNPRESRYEISLFYPGPRSKIAGSVRLFLGDPTVPVIAVAGMVGLSVDGADFISLDPVPISMVHIFQNPNVRSIGSWNMLTGQIAFDLYLTPVPVPQPIHLSGTLTHAGLNVEGDNGPIMDARMHLKIVAYEAPLPPPPLDVWFSTEIGFGAGAMSSGAGGIVRISDGDLLSRRGHIVRTNRELTARLGIMPVVPDLGLDAVMLGPMGQIWFSFEEVAGSPWSETLGTWLKHGDLLSDAGQIVRTNEQLLARFVRMPPVTDVGLDAVARGPNRAILFSTEEGFFSQALGVTVRHGDLLSDRGAVVRTNAQLLANFDPIDMTMGPMAPDYGLDAIVLRPFGEIWFSTETGFNDAHLGSISDGDLLSTRGYVVARNLELVGPFGPVEDITNFGLDAANVVVPCRVGDFDYDGDLDHRDFAYFQASFGASGVPAADPDSGDLDGDGDVDASDLAVLLGCMGGPDTPVGQDR